MLGDYPDHPVYTHGRMYIRWYERKTKNKPVFNLYYYASRNLQAAAAKTTGKYIVFVCANVVVRILRE